MNSHNGSFLWRRVFSKYLREQVSAWYFLHAISCIHTSIFDLYVLVFDRLSHEPDPSNGISLSAH
jgi:hypothetical protein